MSKENNERLIDTYEVEGHMNPHDFCDAYITSATWLDTGEELSEAELDELNDSDYRYDLISDRYWGMA